MIEGNHDSFLPLYKGYLERRLSSGGKLNVFLYVDVGLYLQNYLHVSTSSFSWYVVSLSTMYIVVACIRINISINQKSFRNYRTRILDFNLLS